MISICRDSVYVHKLTGIIYALCCSCLLLCRTHFGPDTVWTGSNLHSFKRVNDGKGESAGSDVTISPEGRRSRSNGAITDSSKQDTICFTGQRKQPKGKKMSG